MNYTQLIPTNTALYPNKPCLHYKENDTWKNYTWSQLSAKVAQTAHALKQLGVQTEDNVAIYAENMAEWILFDLAIVSIGAVSVPIYATSTPEQAQYILNEAQVQTILTGDQIQYDNILQIYTQNEYLKTIIVAKPTVKLVTDSSFYYHDWIQNFPTEWTIETRNPDDLATIIYTSGTTGEPKGVMLTHSNFLKGFDSHINFFKFKNPENEHSLSFLPLSHVFERIWAIFMLHVGAQIYVSENPKLIAEVLKEVKPTMMCSVPRLYQKVYSAVWDKMNKSSQTKQKIFRWALKVGTAYSNLLRHELKPNMGLKIKHAVADKLVFSKIKAQMGGRLWFMPVGGSAISSEITQFFDALGIHLTIGYGLTETTATVTCFPFTQYAYGTAGLPLDGVYYKIGDNNEIWVKGNGVMKGYYKKPEATAEVFTPDGWFKTGDSGAVDAHGNLMIIDRIKDLMKTSNGKYITPQPIENLLTNDNYIQQAVLVGDDKPYVTALLVPNFEALKEMAHQLELKFETMDELVNIQKIKDFYNERVNQLQKNLAGFEKIKNFKLLPMEFNMDLGELTPTLKIKRNIVLQRFSMLIDEMYAT
ncbi:MAG: long-chain fatty acid--CoA ligase [Flavobacteriaceae bacterium]|nr:long-chain fatty acid--CoA ligase [Flavobacteriaceae bacterium]